MKLSAKAGISIALLLGLIVWAGYVFFNAGGVHPDAVKHGSSHFYVYHQALTWNEAKAECAKRGGRLAVIPDQPTQDFLVKLAAGERLWLGAHNRTPGEDWIWVNGDPLNFTVWNPRQPDNFKGREHYLMMSSHGDWSDAWDERNSQTMGMPIVGYICEWPNTAED